MTSIKKDLKARGLFVSKQKRKQMRLVLKALFYVLASTTFMVFALTHIITSYL